MNFELNVHDITTIWMLAIEAEDIAVKLFSMCITT